MSQFRLISNTKIFSCEFDDCFKSYSTVDSRRQHYKRHHHGQHLKGKKYAIGMRGKVTKGHYQIIESELQNKIKSPVKMENIIEEAKQQPKQLTLEEKLLLEEKNYFPMQGISRSTSLNNHCYENSLQRNPPLFKSLSLNNLNLYQTSSINTLPLIDFNFNQSIDTIPLIDFNFM
eukprot:Pgem_evm1s17570